MPDPASLLLCCDVASLRCCIASMLQCCAASSLRCYAVLCSCLYCFSVLSLWTFEPLSLWAFGPLDLRAFGPPDSIRSRHKLKGEILEKIPFTPSFALVRPNWPVPRAKKVLTFAAGGLPIRYIGFRMESRYPRQLLFVPWERILFA